jgi:NDP-sugar pyrophosphorylase family protein
MPLGDGPILDLLLRQLVAQGWVRATLAVGHMADLIRVYCGRGERWGLDLRYMDEEEPLGTVGPLAFMPDEARARPLLVMNGDLLTTLRFRDLVAAHEASGALASIAMHRREVRMEFGVIDHEPGLGPLERVTGYREKPRIGATVSMGVYVFQPEAVAYIGRGERLDLPDLVQRLLDDGRPVGGYVFDGYWLDIGSHGDYSQAVEDFERLRPHLVMSATGEPETP